MAKLHAQVKQLREWRKRKVRDTGIESSILEFRRTLNKSNKQLSSLLEAWDDSVPQELAKNAIPVALRAGVLEVSVTDASTSYKLNQLIRSGLLHTLQQRCTGTLKQIRVRVIKS
jgi:hypothetical protein|tara:strand:- start:490 stop:834 length:345 start_codon:yes stop_codon:yes gene_type:complete